MRTFLAFRYKDDISENELIKKSNLLKDYYQTSYLNYELDLEYSFYRNTGSIIIDDINTPSNYPDNIKCNEIEVTTYFPPLEVVNSRNSVSNEMIELIGDLWRDPKRISNFSAPFLFSVLKLNENRMIIFNDGMALNRLYILETESGVYWSNRPSALLVFSDTRAEIDLDSWKIYAASGWFLNDCSPFKDIKRVQPGILYEININDDKLYETIETNSIEELIKLTSNEPVDYFQVANRMTNELKAFTKLWNVQPEIDISGGVDSRVAAANIIYSGIETYNFRTIEDIEAEVTKANELLEKSNTNKEINVLDPLSYIDKQKNLEERINRILFEFDGDFATVMINSPIIESLNFDTLEKLQIFGFGGEVAKGAFYSNKRWLEKLEKLESDAAYYRLTTHYAKVGCINNDSIELMNHEIQNVLNLAKKYGFSNIKALDFFHFHERFRRWSPSGDRASFYSPFYNKYFISLGLTNEPVNNIKYSVHKSLIHQMKPEWDDISFFKATPEQSKEKDRKKLRIWQTKDRDAVEKILENVESWNDVFVEDEVISVWNQAKSEGIPNFRETLFQRVALRSLFNNHLRFINEFLEK